ncbi:MAG: hypothetical protein AB1714_05960 [Acidobacteriota bacterium]
MMRTCVSARAAPHRPRLPLILGGLLGTIEPGKQADVLVVKDNPLSDLDNLLDVGWVIRSGVVVVAR